MTDKLQTITGNACDVGGKTRMYHVDAGDGNTRLVFAVQGNLFLRGQSPSFWSVVKT
jgi:hypothetical protein